MSLKRTPLTRRKGLRRTGRLQSRPRRQVAELQPARMEWNTSEGGFCQCGCGRFSLHLERHHVLTRNRLRQEQRLDVEWDQRNAMLLHPRCHERHTLAVQRIPLTAVPLAALAFAVEVLGPGPAEVYFDAQYAPRELAA